MFKSEEENPKTPLEVGKNNDFWVSRGRFMVKTNFWDKMDITSVSAGRKYMTYVLVDEIKT